MINALMRLRGVQQPLFGQVEPRKGSVHLHGREFSTSQLALDVPTGGQVIGTLFNFPATLAALGDAVNAPPYQAPPRAPVLYIKPANTWIGAGMAIPVPADTSAVQIGVSLGLVIARTACRVPPAQALDFIAGFTVVNDVSLPQKSFYRPPLRDNARDGFCPVGPWMVTRESLGTQDAFVLRTYVNGELRQQATTAALVRAIPQLLADVTDFMTLNEGDILMVGVPENPPLAKVGDRVAVEVEGVGRLENTLVAEADVLAGAHR